MLTDVKLKSLVAPGRYLDSGKGGVTGLYCQVSVGKDGSPRRSFVLRYKFAGRAREMGLGAYPATSLADARAKAEDARALLRDDTDPLAAKAEARAAGALNSAEAHATFEQAAGMLLKHLCTQRADTKFPGRTVRQWEQGFANHVFPKIGKLDVRDLKHAHIAGVLAPVANGRGKTKRSAAGGWSVAPVLRSRIERVIDFAAAHGLRDPDQVNPARIELLRDVLGSARPTIHFRAAPLSEVPAIYRRLAQEQNSVANAIRFLMLTATRLRETLDARWDEIEEAGPNGPTFTIPPHRSKTRAPHVVPLSDAAWAIIEAQRMMRVSDTIFPGRYGSPLASSTIAPTLARVGKTEGTLHGFRSCFRDWAAENGIEDNVAEFSLNHKVGSSTAQAYFRSTLFDKRKVTMAAYALFLEGREARDNVIPLKFAAE
jgi:integrase